jgi:hypothetical protein
MFSARRGERPRPWNWKDQETAYRQLLDRIEWAKGFNSEVDLRALATRPDPAGEFNMSYIHAHVRPLAPGDEDARRRQSFRYPTAWFEREVISIPEFLARVDAARLGQTAQRRASERELGNLRVGALEAPLSTDGDTAAFSATGFSRMAKLPSWSWRVRLISYGPMVPLVSYSGEAPYFDTRLEFIQEWGGMEWIPEGDTHVGCCNIVVSDPRGVILGVEQQEGDAGAKVRLMGRGLSSLRLQARWTSVHSAGTLSGMGAEEVALPPIEGPAHLSVALVAENDELVDVADFSVVPVPSLPEVLEVIRRGETSLVEFKEWMKIGDSKIHKLERCVVAMANGGDVGTILVGVDDYGEIKWDGWIYGFSSKKEFASQFERRLDAVERYGKRLRDELLTKISPAPVIEVSAVGAEPDVVLKMSVFPSPEWVHDREERIWIRRNASVRPPNNTEIRAKRLSRER